MSTYTHAHVRAYLGECVATTAHERRCSHLFFQSGRATLSCGESNEVEKGVEIRLMSMHKMTLVRVKLSIEMYSRIRKKFQVAQQDTSSSVEARHTSFTHTQYLTSASLHNIFVMTSTGSGSSSGRSCGLRECLLPIESLLLLLS